MLTGIGFLLGAPANNLSAKNKTRKLFLHCSRVAQAECPGFITKLFFFEVLVTVGKFPGIQKPDSDDVGHFLPVDFAEFV